MTKNQLIHIRLDPDEAIESRKDILNTEFNLIKIAKAIKNYRILRLKELQLKIDLYKKTKDFKIEMNKLKTILPKQEIPKLLKKHEQLMNDEKLEKEVKKIKVEREKSKKHEKMPKEEKKHEDTLEKQLREIQDKLNSLG